MQMGEKSIRVITVGRTGAEAALRRDPDIELIRLSAPMEAIGEVVRANGDASIVLVGPEGEPRQSAADAADWVAGLRRASPSVRIVRILESKDQGAALPPYDATTDLDQLSDTLDNLTGRADPPSLLPDPHQPVPASRNGIHAAESSIGDAELVAALIRGEDIHATALTALSNRLATPAQLLNTPSETTVEVRWRDRLFGHLSAPGVDPSRLASHAAWLASWLRFNEQQAELRRAAFTDPLTGAWNRRYFDRFLPAAIERAKTSRATVTVLMFDIDDFKRFNEKYGHGAGDEILVQTVKLLRSVIRPSDRVFRLGGDEFVVVFHEPHGPRQKGSKPPESVFAISQRFQKQICEHRFPKLAEEAPGTLTISGGLATYPWDGRDADELLERADQLAAESKRLGKNAITLGPGAARACTSDHDHAAGEHS